MAGTVFDLNFFTTAEEMCKLSHIAIRDESLHINNRQEIQVQSRFRSKVESGAYKYACSILKRSSITRFLNNSVEINLNGRNKLQWINQDYD